ncbi:MAG: type II toxin-antitoxin system HigB family toxin [Methylobacter sp.]|nr:type II toxin-antitoxin system HigB family toxin [Methylobacter sp.]
MRIISRKAIREFEAIHAQATAPLKEWRNKMEALHCNNYAELKQNFNPVDKAGMYFIFNIAGNKYRLIAAIHFNKQTLYIRNILTHEEYNQWKP